MNVWRIALFVFMIQTAVQLTTLANVPISCTADGTACVYFNADTLRSSDMGSIISNQIDTSAFQSTQITQNIFTTDLFTFTSTALNVITNFIYMSVFGIYSFITFVFGSGVVSVAFAGAMQVIVYFFYGRLLSDVLRPGSRGEA